MKKVEKSKKDPYTNHLQNAYDWYNTMRKKEDKSSLEISYIITIEEKHKMEIIKQYHVWIRETPETPEFDNLQMQ